MNNLLTPNIERFLKELTHSVRGIDSIWLIGSRANSRSRPSSDWDFLIFANEEAATAIESLHELRREDVDLLVVRDNGSFSQSWFVPSAERKKPKSGTLTTWEWQKLSEHEATYKAAKTRANSLHIDIDTKKAIRVWP